MEHAISNKGNSPAANRNRSKKSSVTQQSAKERLLDHFATMIDKQQTLQSNNEFAASKREFDEIIEKIRASHVHTREIAE